MSDQLNTTSPFRKGDVVDALYLRLDASSGQFVLQLAGNVPAYLSTYDVSDEQLDTITPGSSVRAVVDRVEADAAGRDNAILYISPVPICR